MVNNIVEKLRNTIQGLRKKKVWKSFLDYYQNIYTTSNLQ